MFTRLKLLWQGARSAPKNAQLLTAKRNYVAIFGLITKRHPVRNVASVSKSKKGDANWLQKSTIRKLISNIKEKDSLRAIKMLAYLVSTNECYANELLDQHGAEVLRALFEESLQSWRDNSNDEHLMPLLRLMANMTHYERPKRVFHTTEWIHHLNSLTAEKNVEVVNYVSSILSNLALAPTVFEEGKKELLDGLGVLIKNQYCSEDAYHRISVALATLSSKDEQLAGYMVKTGLVRRLKKITALPDERVQLQIAKVISNLSSFEDLRKIVVAQGWLEQLRYWGESNSKQVRLQAIQVLSNLVKDESIVVQLLEQQGLELILSMGELVDIDIQHAVERVINQLKTPDVLWVPREYKLDDNFDLVEQQRVA